MSIAGMLNKWKRVNALAADSGTKAVLRALFGIRYRYPGIGVLHFIYKLPGAERIQLNLRGKSGPMYLILRPNDPGDVASFFENFVEAHDEAATNGVSGIMLDAGAHIGCYSVAFHDRSPATEIIALEPEPVNAKILRDNFSLNHINGQIIEAALWRESTTLQFQHGQSNAGHISSILEGTSVSVRAVTFAEALGDRLPELTALKIDIEGAETEVLPELLAAIKHPCRLLVEIHHAASMRPALEQLWAKHGWSGNLSAHYPPHEVWVLQR